MHAAPYFCCIFLTLCIKEIHGISETASNFKRLIAPYCQRESPQVRRENAKTEKNGPETNCRQCRGRVDNVLELFEYFRVCAG